MTISGFLGVKGTAVKHPERLTESRKWWPCWYLEDSSLLGPAGNGNGVAGPCWKSSCSVAPTWGAAFNLLPSLFPWLIADLLFSILIDDIWVFDLRLSVVFLGAWIVSNFPKPFGILAVVPSSPLRCVSRWQDIVIGAPQYFDRDGEVGGAVYVYINQQGKWSNVKPIRLNGTKDSMFGISVKNIGDINQDGYPGGW